MRFLLIQLLVVVALGSTPAMASAFVRPTGKIILLDASDGRGADVPSVSRGEQFAVDCGCLGSRGDVRVVLALGSDEKPTGFRRMLVTDERVDHGALRVRVPDAPSLAKHTVDVRIYVVGADGIRACDAGKVKIT
jgi:hypothetical protein